MARLLDYVLHVESKDSPWASYPWNSTTRKQFAQDMYPCIQQSDIGKDITALLTEAYSMDEIMHESIDFGMLNMTRMEALSLYNDIIAYAFADIAHRYWIGNASLSYYVPSETTLDKTRMGVDISTLVFSAVVFLIIAVKIIFFIRRGEEFLPI